MFMRENVQSTVYPDNIRHLQGKLLVVDTNAVETIEKEKEEEFGDNTTLYQYDEKVYEVEEWEGD